MSQVVSLFIDKNGIRWYFGYVIICLILGAFHDTNFMANFIRTKIIWMLK